MAKQRRDWLGPILGFLGGLLVGVPATVLAFLQYYDAKPTIIYGYVENSAPKLTVHLDNDSQSQVVDHNNGYFRFADLTPGTHNLRFEHVSFESFSYPVVIDGPGEHGLPAKVVLPKSPEGNRSGPTLRTVSIQHSDDGSDPLTKFVGDNKGEVVVFASAKGEIESGWVYVDEGTVDTKFTNWLRQVGSTAELTELAVVRAGPPSESKRAEGYELGTPLGTIDPGQKVQLRGFYKIEGKDPAVHAYWANVKVIEPETIR